MSHSNIPGLGFICPGNLTYAGRISPCSLDTVVFGTLALYMFLVVVRRAWKSSRDSSATTTRPRRYPQALHPLMTAVQALVLLICATCLFQTLYLVVLQQTDPTVPLVPTYLLPYSALHFLAWLANYLILSSDKRHNRTYYLPAQAFWLLALVAAQVELYDRTLYLVGTDEEEDGPAKVAPVFVANWVLFAAFVVRYALTWALVIVAGILEWKVHHGDEWGSDGERSDDETVDEVNGRIGQYRRLTPDLNNGDGDVENSPTTISPTPLDDATHALFTNGLGKDYGTLSKRPRRARRASSTTTTTTTATTVPVQTLTSSPHTNYIAKLRRLFPFMWPRNDRRLQLLIVLCLLLLVAERVVNVLLPISYKNVVDALAKEGGGGRVVWKEILIFVGLRMLQGGVGFIGTAQKGLWVPIGQFTTRELQVRMFEHLLNLSLRFHLNRKTGEILRVQDRGVTSIVTLLTTICFNILPTLTDVTVACVYFTLAFDGWFGAIVLTTMAAYVGFTMRLTEWRMRYRRETNRLENEMEAKAVDALLNYETVKLYANEKFEVEQYEKAIVSYQQADLKSNTVAMTISTVQNVILQVGLLTGCLLCARRVTMGTMTVGDFVAYIGYMTQLYGPLSGFGSYYRSMQKNFVDMEKMLDLMQEPVEVKDLPQAASLKATKGDVVFDNVSFYYDKRSPTLRNISFRVPSGTTVALVGESGSGKSTITRLLLRFFDVASGRILIDGHDVRFVKQEELRKCIGVVPQETVLFNDTIRYNIRYGKVNASDKAVEEAAEAAQIHSKIVDFPDGYNTRVGERGMRLSGGEKQRVGIARTMLKNPQIVVLDEATSALDSTTERHIQASLRRITTNRTGLVIAHRLSTIADADLILVLKRGEVVERGTHEELLRIEGGVYRDMWAKQQEGVGEEEGGRDDEGSISAEDGRDDEGSISAEDERVETPEDEEIVEEELNCQCEYHFVEEVKGGVDVPVPRELVIRGGRKYCERCHQHRICELERDGRGGSVMSQ